MSSLIKSHGDRGLRQSKIDQIIDDIAKSITSKGSSTYQEKTIAIYLKAYLERPNLTREDRLEVCISNTKNKKIKSEFLDKCGSGTLATWEKKLDKTIEEYKTVLAL